MSHPAHTTVLIVEGDFIYRNYLEKIIRDIETVNAVLKAENAKQAIDMLIENPACTIVIIACRTAEINGAALTREIKTEFPHLNIIAISHAFDCFSVIEMIESGALSYIVKGASRSDYIEVVSHAIKNRPWFSPSVAQYIIQNIHHGNQSNAEITSPAELPFKVLRHVCMGFTSKEIYEKTGIPERSVQGYRSKLIKQYNVNTPAELVAEVIRRGIINIDAINREKKEILEREKKKKKT